MQIIGTDRMGFKWSCMHPNKRPAKKLMSIDLGNNLSLYTHMINNTVEWNTYGAGYECLQSVNLSLFFSGYDVAEYNKNGMFSYY